MGEIDDGKHFRCYKGLTIMTTKGIIAKIVAIYIVALLGFFLFQRQFLYFPSDTYVSPKTCYAPSALKEMDIKTEDGLALKSWYAPATTKPFSLVFFHGNGDSLCTAAAIAEPYINAGYGFMLVGYRGYNGLPGSPSETGLYTDARAALKKLTVSGVPNDSIVLFGYSLGTGVATQMATEFPVRGLILLAPYLSIPKMAQVRFPMFPAEYLALDRFENFKKISTLHLPLFIANGEKDLVIPPIQGQQLFHLANEPKTFLSVPKKGHNDLFENPFVNVSLNWLQELPKEIANSKRQSND
jgi:hypothetical protein